MRANGEVTTAFRLSPIQTVHAALLVNDPHALGFESVLTHFLGGAAGQPYTGEIGTRPGDLLVVCSDGTDVDDSVESFASALSRIATEVRGAGRPVGPATPEAAAAAPIELASRCWPMVLVARPPTTASPSARGSRSGGTASRHSS